MTEVAEKTAEVVAENVEELVDGVVDTVEIVRNNPVTLALVGLVGLAAGGVGGYFFAARKLGKQFEERLEEEIEQTKEFYAGIYKTDTDGAVLTPQDVLSSRMGQEAVDAVRFYQGRTAEAPAPSEEDLDELEMSPEEEALLDRAVEAAKAPSESRNVFVDPNFDFEEELKYRTPDKPYIITHDEFFENELDYEQSSLTYYEEDDTLINERDEPQREIDKLIGEDHLVRFGHGSKDKNIVYVRNDRLQLDFEITKSSGSYVKEVLGMLDEGGTSLKHSAEARRAFRRGDE